MFRTLRGRIAATYFLVVFISLLLASLFFTFFLARYTRRRERSDLLDQVGAIAEDVRRVSNAFRPQKNAPGDSDRPPQPAGGDPGALVAGILDAEAGALDVKLLLVAPDGKVAAESGGRPTFGSRTLDLPSDVVSEKGPRIYERFFKRLRRDYLFATAPTTLPD